jgi:hypothetical protein
MYVRSILAQAGVIHAEVPGGEDHLAVDIAVIFPVGTVTVQVKTGASKEPNSDGSFSVSTTEKWRDKWANAKTPVFLVYVHLEEDQPPDWVDHADAHTVIHAHAHWLKVNNLSDASAKLPLDNRLTATTFDEWAEEFDAFGEAASA